MSVKVLYFAGLKEALGLPGESIELPDCVATVGGFAAGDAHGLLGGGPGGDVAEGVDAGGEAVAGVALRVAAELARVEADLAVEHVGQAALVDHLGDPRLARRALDAAEVPAPPASEAPLSPANARLEETRREIREFVRGVVAAPAENVEHPLSGELARYLRDGPGIAPELRLRLFQPFAAGDARTLERGWS